MIERLAPSNERLALRSSTHVVFATTFGASLVVAALAQAARYDHRRRKNAHGAWEFIEPDHLPELFTSVGIALADDPLPLESDANVPPSSASARSQPR